MKSLLRTSVNLTLAVSLVTYLSSCSTTQTTSKADKDSDSVDVISNTDKKSAVNHPSDDGNVTKSVSKLEAKLSKNPKDISSWLNLANLFIAQGKASEAEEAARKALRLDIKNTEAKKVLAQVALIRGQRNLSMIILNGLGGAQSKDADVLNLMALALLADSKPTQAVQLFQAAIKIDPSHVAARMNLGVAYLKYRMLQPASVQFERVMKIMPDNPDAKLHLAVIKATRGDFVSAESMYREILKMRTNHPIALYNLAVLQQRKGDYTSSIDSLKLYLKSSNAKAGEADEAFALIERIKDKQAADSKTSGTVEDESDSFANKKPQTQNVSTNQTVEPSSKPATANSGDAEVDRLEKSLIE